MEVTRKPVWLGSISHLAVRLGMTCAGVLVDEQSWF